MGPAALTRSHKSQRCISTGVKNKVPLTLQTFFTLPLFLRSRSSNIQSQTRRVLMAFSDSRNSIVRKYAEIIVIRHGETEWNADRRIQGQLDVDLNDVGRQQAFALAERLSREPKINAVYSSDLKRAFETARVIAKCCGELEVTKDPNFRERHLGDLQGVLFDEAAKVNPEAYEAFCSNMNDLKIPGGGESYNQLFDRCTSALQRIAKKHIGDRVVVVSHGASIEALYTRARPSENCRCNVLNASLNVIHLFDDEDEWYVKSWGDVSHLKPTGFLESGFGGERNSG